MRNIKLTIEYDGTNYNGWQVQAQKDPRNKTPLVTVQGVIQAALKKIFKKKINLIGSGRTDSGVHAQGQIANFKIDSRLAGRRSKMPLEKIQAALNGNLPADIAILKVQEAGEKFHSQYSVKSKTYRYTILNREVRSPLLRNLTLIYPAKLNIALMKKEARALIGRRNFKSFQATPDKRFPWKNKSTIRTIKRIDIKKSADTITIDIEADGFLHKMVRNIVGTLLDIGTGKLPKGSLKKILAHQDRAKASSTAKPYGLMLLEVKY